MEKYRYLCFYANLSSNTLFICFFGQIQKIGKIVYYLFI